MFAGLACGCAAVAFALAEDADTAVFPRSGDLDFAVVGRAALDRHAAGAHHGEERLDAVDAVPKQVGMMRLEMGRAEGFAAENFTVFSGARGECGLGEAQRGGTEHRHVVALGQAINFHAIGESAGEWFVDEERLAGLDDVDGVLEVRAAVDVLDHHRIDVPAKLGDGGVKFHAPFAGQLGGVFVDSRVARLDIGAAVLDGGDHPGAGDVVFVGLVVEDAGEGDDVRGVEPDHADFQVGRLAGCDEGGSHCQPKKSSGLHARNVSSSLAKRKGKKVGMALRAVRTELEPAGSESQPYLRLNGAVEWLMTHQ